MLTTGAGFLYYPGGLYVRPHANPTPVGMGTAQTVQAGFLLPRHWLGPKVRLQPYTDYIYGCYEGLRRPDGTLPEVHILNAGLNLLVDGQHAKITLNYRARSDFTDLSHLVYRPEIVLQTQIAL